MLKIKTQRRENGKNCQLVYGTKEEILEYVLPRIRSVSYNYYEEEIPKDLEAEGWSFVDVHAGCGTLYYCFLTKNGFLKHRGNLPQCVKDAIKETESDLTVEQKDRRIGLAIMYNEETEIDDQVTRLVGSFLVLYSRTLPIGVQCGNVFYINGFNADVSQYTRQKINNYKSYLGRSNFRYTEIGNEEFIDLFQEELIQIYSAGREGYGTRI